MTGRVGGGGEAWGVEGKGEDWSGRVGSGGEGWGVRGMVGSGVEWC